MLVIIREVFYHRLFDGRVLANFTWISLLPKVTRNNIVIRWKGKKGKVDKWKDVSIYIVLIYDRVENSTIYSR